MGVSGKFPVFIFLKLAHFDISDEYDEKLSKVISYDDAIELLRRDFPSKHDMFVREKMKKQRESMVMNVSAEEMPAQLRKAAKSVSVIFLTELCKS